MAEVIVALDLPEVGDALDLIARLPELRWVKVGATLFTKAGPALLDELKQRGLGVFLDLKWHDIPHQVAGAVAAAADYGVDLATVHALGGRAMMEAARDAAAGRLRLVAVTVLTSHDAAGMGEVLGRDGVVVDREVVRLARLAAGAGLDGVVASANEATAVREVLPPEAWIVVPGIRPPGSPMDDQRRVADPATAVAAGATHLVVGRPITRAKEPAQVYQALCEAAV